MVVERLLAGETHQRLGLGQGTPAIVGVLVVEGHRLIGRTIDHKDRHHLYRIQARLVKLLQILAVVELGDPDTRLFGKLPNNGLPAGFTGLHRARHMAPEAPLDPLHHQQFCFAIDSGKGNARDGLAANGDHDLLSGFGLCDSHEQCEGVLIEIRLGGQAHDLYFIQSIFGQIVGHQIEPHPVTGIFGKWPVITAVEKV